MKKISSLIIEKNLFHLPYIRTISKENQELPNLEEVYVHVWYEWNMLLYSICYNNVYTSLWYTFLLRSNQWWSYVLNELIYEF